MFLFSQVQVEPWKDKKRDVKYLIPRNNFIAANHAVEHQEITVDEPGGCIVDVSTDTPEVPFGKSMYWQLCVYWQLYRQLY